MNKLLPSPGKDTGARQAAWLVAAAAIDRPRDIQAARRLVGRDLPAEPAVLADPATDLRKLLRARPVREER